MTPKEPSHSKQKEETPFHKALSRSWQDAFSKDSQLVHKVREEYFQENCPHFNSETSYDLADVFQRIIKSASLLHSEIYEIQETWTGGSELQDANYALKTLPKGLKFFHPVSPSESLTSIHHPNALHHFNGVIHCLWCGKEGQIERNIINHLQRTHYKLGLVCKKCFCCLLVTSEAIWHHGHKNCQPYIDGDPDKSSSLA